LARPFVQIRKNPPCDDYDTPWKSAIEAYFREFLSFYFPATCAAIDCAERIFVYHYRLFDHFHCPIASLVLLADPSPSWRPEASWCGFAGCGTGIQFPVAKLLDCDGMPGLRARHRAVGRTKGGLSWQLAMKFGPLREEVRMRVEAADEEQLKRWSVAVLSAATLGEVFGG
jgi:hypothetical protein